MPPRTAQRDRSRRGRAAGVVGTDKGRAGKSRVDFGREKTADILKKRSSKAEIQKIEEFEEFLNDLTRDELLAFTYFSYPAQEELEKESVEYRDLLPGRRSLAVL